MTRTTQTVRRLGSETARTLLVLVVTALALTAPVAAATPAVSATGGTVAPGGEVTVEISLDNAQTAKLSDIPSDWSVVSHDDDGGSFRNNIDSDGLVGWVWLSGDQSSASVSVTFNVPDDATSRDLSVTVEDSEIDILPALKREDSSVGGSATDPRRQLAGLCALLWDFREGVVSPTNRGRPTRIARAVPSA